MRVEVFALGEDPAPPRKHPAKMNGQLARILIREYSRPGDLVLDPFAGSHTTGWAARSLNRRYLGLDIERHFLSEDRTGLLSIWGDVCALPLRDGVVDLIVTSPPYGEAIGRAGDRKPEKTIKAKQRYEEKRFGQALTTHAVYGSTPNNLGSMPLERSAGPCFVRLFPKAVVGMGRVLRPGGCAILVVRDQRRGRRRLGVFDLPGFVVQEGEKAGLIYEGRRVAVIPEKSWTLWQRVNAERWDIPIPNAEHVVVLRRRGA